MKVLEKLFDSLELDNYPYRIPIIALSVTVIIAAVVGYFAFLKF